MMQRKLTAFLADVTRFSPPHVLEERARNEVTWWSYLSGLTTCSSSSRLDSQQLLLLTFLLFTLYWLPLKFIINQFITVQRWLLAYIVWGAHGCVFCLTCLHWSSLLPSAAQDSPDVIDVSQVDSTPLGVYVYYYLSMVSDLHFLKTKRKCHLITGFLWILYSGKF